ncbi:MAG: response regulator [Ginsengibacter sp.]
MNANAGPVIVIEDDIDDQEILTEVFKKLDYGNEVIFFSDGHAALDYLNKTDIVPFLILSDINLPKLSGFELRDKIRIDEKLDVKCIPYLFFTTASNQKVVIEAYSKSVQGFFIKPNKVSELENTIRIIMDYWKCCVSPKST